MLALGNVNAIVLIGAVYFTFNSAGVVTLIKSFTQKRGTVTLWIWAATTFLFGLGLSVLFSTDGTSFSDDWPDWLLAVVPLICGGVSCLRMLFVRHEQAG